MATKPEASSPENAALGARFREVRRAHKVYLRPLAEALGCSLNTIRWHEAGDRMLRVDQLVVAARVIGVEPADLLSADHFVDANKMVGEGGAS